MAYIPFPMFPGRLIVPEAFAECLTYEQQVLWLARAIQRARSLAADATVDGTAGNPTVTVTETVEDGVPHLVFNFSGLKGEKGDPGEAQAPNIGMTVTVDDTTGTPTATVTVSGAGTMTPQYEIALAGIKGEPSDPPEITLDVEVDGTTGTPTATVTQSGTPDRPVYLIDFSGLKGEKGEPGEAPNIGMTVTVDDTTGTPTATVTQSGTPDRPVYLIDFSGLKGEKGEPGEAPNIGMTVTVDDTTGTPTATVTQSGTPDRPVYLIDFSGLKGEKGEPGADGQPGQQGPKGDPGEGVPPGGTTGQVLTKTADGTAWEDPAGGTIPAPPENPPGTIPAPPENPPGSKVPVANADGTVDWHQFPIYSPQNPNDIKGLFAGRPQGVSGYEAHRTINIDSLDTLANFISANGWAPGKPDTTGAVSGDAWDLQLVNQGGAYRLVFTKHTSGGGSAIPDPGETDNAGYVPTVVSPGGPVTWELPIPGSDNAENAGKVPVLATAGTETTAPTFSWEAPGVGLPEGGNVGNVLMQSTDGPAWLPPSGVNGLEWFVVDIGTAESGTLSALRYRNPVLLVLIVMSQNGNGVEATGIIPYAEAILWLGATAVFGETTLAATRITINRNTRAWTRSGDLTRRAQIAILSKT